MPKKTKKQKLMAQAHREKVESRPFEPVTFTFVKGEFNGREAIKAGQAQQFKKSVDSGQTTILASTRKDLVKTFFLASVILVSEAVLYFLWN